MNGPRGYFTSAGENVGVDCRLSWVSRLIREVSQPAPASRPQRTKTAARERLCHG